MKSTTRCLQNDLSAVREGIHKTANAVKSTMGAQGKTVLILNNDQLKITKDGISVAESINLEDHMERAGSQLAINAARKTVDEVGDGTTATCVLLQGMLEQCNIEDRGTVNEVLDQMEDAVSKIEDYLRKNSHQVENVDQVKNIANISSNSEVIGTLLYDIYAEVGLDANVSVELSETSSKTNFEVTKGIEFRPGMISSKFANRKNGDCVFDKPVVYISKKPVVDFNDEYIALLDYIQKEQKSMLIIAPSYSEAFIRSILYNVQKASLNCCLVKSPGFGEGINKNYDDISSFLNNKGEVDKAIIGSHTFTLFNQDTPYLEERLEELLELSKNSIDKYDADDYMNRYHSLKGASAIVFAGGTTPQNAKEEYDRIEDALGSIKAAIEYGYVEGGGLALLKASSKLKSSDYGTAVIKAVCAYPSFVILENANESGIQLKDEGYNVRTRRFENFLETGVIDPTEVVIKSLRNAFATFKLLINTNYAIYNEVNYDSFLK